MAETDPSRLAGRWRRTVAGLDAPLRAPFLRAEVRGDAVAVVAAALDRICADSEQGDSASHEVLVAFVDVVAEPDFEPVAQTLREEAAGQALLALARILRRPLRPQSLRPASSPAIPDYGRGRPLTLGERRALARRPTRAALEKLLADPHPMVIAVLLANPKLVEEDVVRLAARRPTMPEVQLEIARSRRFAHYGRVRMALVLNPYTPSETAIPLLGLLTRPDLRVVVTSTEVPTPVRAAAREHLERRPPVRKADPTAVH